MSGTLQLYEGRCHCGAVGFAYRTSLPPPAWSIRACQCAFCRAHSALSTSDPAGALAFDLGSGNAAHRYRFGQRTADFLICARCGVYIGASIETSAGRFGIVNVNALTVLPAGVQPAVPVRYDDETVGQRIGRREARWTPLV